MPLVHDPSSTNYKVSSDSLYVVVRHFGDSLSDPPSIISCPCFADAIQKFNDHLCDYSGEIHEYPVFVYHQTFANDYSDHVVFNYLFSSEDLYTFATEAELLDVNGEPFTDMYNQNLMIKMGYDILGSQPNTLTAMVATNPFGDSPDFAAEELNEAAFSEWTAQPILASQPILIDGATGGGAGPGITVQVSAVTGVFDPNWVGNAGANAILPSQPFGVAFDPFEPSSQSKILNVSEAGELVLDYLSNFSISEYEGDQLRNLIIHGCVSLDDYLPDSNSIANAYSLDEDEASLIHDFMNGHKQFDISLFNNSFVDGVDFSTIGAPDSFSITKYNKWLDGVRYLIFLGNGDVISLVKSLSVNPPTEDDEGEIDATYSYSMACIDPSGTQITPLPYVGGINSDIMVLNDLSLEIALLFIKQINHLEPIDLNF